MRYLLILPIVVYTIGDTFGLPLSLALGLSLKNVVLYFVSLMLALRMVTSGGGYKLELPNIHAYFAILIGYALLSIFVAGLIIRYDDYHIVGSIITAKSALIDGAVILGLFFYGTRSIADGVFLTKVLVAAVTVANIIDIASIQGYVAIPDVAATPGEGGRVQGAFGGANGTAALVVAMFPAYVAIARSSTGVWPLVWIAGAMSSLAMLLMTASRGAFVAMLIGYPCAAYVFRRYLSFRQVFLWTGGLTVLGAVILSLAGTHFVALFLERVITESGASDFGALSSGRSDIWARALGRMMAVPVTLITGFGWNVYDTMGFWYVPHNQYLLVWFELGLVGVCSFVFLLLRILTTVRSGAESGNAVSRSYLMAFVFGFGAFLIALFFSNLSQPWTYVWAYSGVSLRMALIGVEAKNSAAGSPPANKVDRAAADAKRQVASRGRTTVARR